MAVSFNVFTIVKLSVAGDGGSARPNTAVVVSKDTRSMNV
jgi:hypothetical protein